MWSGDDQSVLFVGADPADQTRSDIYSVREGAAAVVLTDQPGFKTAPMVDSRGATLVYTVSAQSPLAGRAAGAGRGGGGGGGGRGGGAGAGITYGVVSLADKTTRTVTGTALTLSADGSTVAWLTRDGETTTLNAAPVSTLTPTPVRAGRERIDALALSPDGKQVAYQLMTNTDWEIYVSPTTPAAVSASPAAGAGAGAAATATAHRRVTRDIQHDLLPRFLSNSTLIGLKGEARHRRSYLYDLTTGASTRLFSNNSIRTISPEYVWIPSADGRFLILQAERDGDTVSTERDISVVDLTRKISMADLQARLDRQLAVESDLRSA
jgi:Tol biopolymer transport system component